MINSVSVSSACTSSWSNEAQSSNALAPSRMIEDGILACGVDSRAATRRAGCECYGKMRLVSGTSVEPAYHRGLARHLLRGRDKQGDKQRGEQAARQNGRSMLRSLARSESNPQIEFVYR